MGKISSTIPFQIRHKPKNPLIQRIILNKGYAGDTILYNGTGYEGYNVAQSFRGIKYKYRKIYGMQ